MVKTRGLGHALGRVVGRGLGRGDGDDSDGAPQHRRPTASAHRRRVTVIVDDVVPAVPADSSAVPETEAVVARDEPMVDADAQDTGPDTDAQDIGTQDAADEPEGFLGGPKDPSVLTEYADHVAANVWSGQECPELMLCSHGRKEHNLGRLVPAIDDMETSSFHLPVGEVSITLDEDASLLHLPIVGTFHDFQPLRTDEVVVLLVELLMVLAEVAMTETGQYGGPYVRLQCLRDVYQCRCQTQHWIAAARAYLLHLLGCTLFANKSATHVHVSHLQALCYLTLAGRYAWGAADLVHMYDQLNDASLNTSRQLAVAECNADLDYDEVSPHVCWWITTKKTMKKVSTAMYRQRLDHLRIPDVCWMPYTEHQPVQDFHPISCFSGQLRWGPVVIRYRLERVMHQFSYVQCILAHSVHSWVSYDDVDNTWMHYSDHLVAAGNLCVMPTDPPRDAYAMQPNHIPHEAALASTQADLDADEPRHAVEACHAITEALEQHLNAPGTSTHEEVIQKCLSIVRGVTEDRNVYVRSRRRCHTDQQ
ncbi:Protein MAIN-LIKE 1 [Glycine max]|nr:Protein MAIN-LIKE 1 [Glycine max]